MTMYLIVYQILFLYSRPGWLLLLLLLLQGTSEFLHLHIFLMQISLHLHILLAVYKLACFAAAYNAIHFVFQCAISILLQVCTACILNNFINPSSPDAFLTLKKLPFFNFCIIFLQFFIIFVHCILNSFF